MKEKKAKLKIEDIKVESFLTSSEDISEIIGGKSLPNDCAPTLVKSCYLSHCCSDLGTCSSNPCC